MINFEDKNVVLEALIEVFPIERHDEVSIDLINIYEGDGVYYFFHGVTWYDLIKKLDFKLHGDVLEKGCFYLSKKDFIYYIPLYIYASIVNLEGWAFEYSFFIHYLTPDVMGEYDYFCFTNAFSEVQRVLIYEFIVYKMEKKNDLLASDAFNKFWCLYS